MYNQFALQGLCWIITPLPLCWCKCVQLNHNQDALACKISHMTVFYITTKHCHMALFIRCASVVGTWGSNTHPNQDVLTCKQAKQSKATTPNTTPTKKLPLVRFKQKTSHSAMYAEHTAHWSRQGLNSTTLRLGSQYVTLPCHTVPHRTIPQRWKWIHDACSNVVQYNGGKQRIVNLA